MKLRVLLQLLMLTYCSIWGTVLIGQNILLDENFQDWQSITSFDDKGDSSGLDIESISIANDSENIYFNIKLDREISIQDDNNITLSIETDDFTMTFNFGDKEGRIFQSGFDPTIFQNDIGLVSSPSVTSDEFEILMKRDWQNEFVSNTLRGDLQISIQNGNADRLPNSGTITYQLTDDIPIEIPSYNLEKPSDSDLRICTYNVRRDNLFETDTRAAYSNVLKIIDADILAFQEINDHTDVQTLSRVLNVFNALDNTTPWHSSKRGNDIVILSKYPITFAREIAGNGVFVINKNGQDILLINVHLACCENDNGRENEINALLSFIKDAREGNENYDLQPDTPIIITGDTNFVGNSDQVTALQNGFFLGNSSADDFNIDWDDTGLADSKPFTTGFNSTYTWFSPTSRFFAGRLDYIFYSDSNMEALNAFVLVARGLTQEELLLYNLEPTDTGVASDHLPVITDFKLLNTSATTELDPKPFLLYPNPASTHIQLSDAIEWDQVSIYNSSGALITVDRSQIVDISSFSPGSYFAIFKNKKGQSVAKEPFIVKR